jgi:hypothetical protein
MNEEAIIEPLVVRRRSQRCESWVEARAQQLASELRERRRKK